MNPGTTSDQELKLQLTRLYVALTLSRNVAGQLVEKDPENKVGRSLTTLLAVTEQMLESMLDPAARMPQTSEELVEVSHVM